MGTLYIVATPIGNLEDITIRAIKILFTADIVACEDTRHTGLLLSELRKRYDFLLREYNLGDMHPKLLRYDNVTEQNTSSELITLIEHGKNIALVSDAGTPLLSDPGFVLVREARKRNIQTISIPGASALLAALSSSGLPTDKFIFLGFPPEKQSQRNKLFSQLPKETTIIMYCSPHKIIHTLNDIQQLFGNIPITVARELTKVYESIWSGTILMALEKPELTKGELVLLFRTP